MDNNDKDAKQRARKPFWHNDTTAESRGAAIAKILDDEIAKLAQTRENFNDALNPSAFACFQIAAGARQQGVAVPSDSEIEVRLRAAIPEYFKRDPKGGADTIRSAKTAGLAKPRWPSKFGDKGFRFPAPRGSPAQQATPKADDDAKDAVKSATAARIWDESVPIHGTLAERYLMDSRMIDTMSIPAPLLANLRYHPTTPIGDGFNNDQAAPALIARLSNSLTGEPANAIQRTFLNTDGTKATNFGRNGRLSLGKYGDNGAVMFGSPGDHDDHIECESIEDVLTVLCERPGATGMAVLSVSRLGKLEIRSGVKRIVAGDAKSERDKAAAAEAAQKLADRTCRAVRLALPPDGFGDFNDVIKSTEPGRVRAAVDAASLVKPRLPGLQFGDQPIVFKASDPVVKGVIGRGELGAVYGPSTAGKTFFTLDFAWHVALGRSYLGRRVRAGPVLYVNFEGARGFQTRMEAVRRALGSAPRFARLTVGAMLGRSEVGSEGQKTIIEEARKLALAVDQPVSLIVIDTLARAMAGDDENMAADMTAFITRCNAISEATGAAVIVVHHTGKDTDKGMRGSSALFAACDFVGVVEHKKGESARAIRFEKVKDGEVGNPVPFALRQVELGTDEDGDPITSCVVDIENVGPIDKRPAASPMQYKVLNNFDQIILEGRFEVTTEREGIPGGVKAVRLEDLIDRCLKSGVTSSEKNARTVIKNEIQKLQTKDWLCQFDGLVWKLDRRH